MQIVMLELLCLIKFETYCTIVVQGINCVLVLGFSKQPRNDQKAYKASQSENQRSL